VRIYLAGPYTEYRNAQGTLLSVDYNIGVAEGYAAGLYRRGHTPFCPHTMTARFERNFPDIPRQVYLETDLEWLELCDAILLLPGWEESEGAKIELERAKELGLKIYYDAGDIPACGRDAQ